MTASPELPWLASLFRQSAPKDPLPILDWAEKFVHLPGSARAPIYRRDITPWTTQIIEWADDGITRRLTFVKPVQSGGSVVGEVILARWIATKNSGDIQYNWQNDEKADERWKKRIERILRACGPVVERWPSDRAKSQTGLVIFPQANLTVQGVFTKRNVASDSIKFQINEEIHDTQGWLPGRLQQAYGRTTAFWDSVILNISNAGKEGDQLHEALLSGTNQPWEVKCPGCHQFHAMRTEWDDKNPQLGGLRYDSAASKRDDGSYDYNKLAATVRFQMPCGFIVHEDRSERRALSLSGRYGEPRNTGAQLTERSASLEAVSVDYIPWIELIKQKHDALKSLRYGDPEPWSVYLRERECRFWSDRDRPLMGKVVVNTSLKKDREGLKNHKRFYQRLYALDRQQGSLARGELPHWWLVIRDVLDGPADSLLVFEGKIETDENVIEVLDRHECVRHCGVADSGDDTMHVYQFCLRYGINAIKGGKEAFYAHRDGSKKIYSPSTPLHEMINFPSLYPYTYRQVMERNREGVEVPIRKLMPDEREPMFWRYSKYGIRDRLAYLRSGQFVKHEVPSDVSDDYKKHNEAEELIQEPDVDGVMVSKWKQISERNDLFVDECYISMMMEQDGLIGSEAGN